MENLDSLLKKDPELEQVTGNWFLAQWIPDIATGEILNIGVSFVDSTGQHNFKMLDNYDRLSCLFNNSNAPFHAELACKVAREHFLKNPSISGSISPSLKIEQRGFAQGKSIDEILTRLYSSVITLGKPKPKQPRKDKFQHISMENAYNHIKRNLKKSLNIDFSLHVPVNPYHEVKDDFGTERIYLPFTRNNDKHAASLATAAYSDSFRVKSYLYDGFRNVETALNKNLIDEGALFIVLPGKGLEKSTNEQINDELSTFYSFTKRHGIYLESNESIPDLTNSINDWCLNNITH